MSQSIMTDYLLSQLDLADCLQMNGNCSTNQKPGNSGNSAEHDQNLIRPGGPIMSTLTKFELKLVSGLSSNLSWISARSRKWRQAITLFDTESIMHGKYSTNQRPGNSMNSVEQDQKLIRPGESHNEFTHQIWAQSPQWQMLRNLKCDGLIDPFLKPPTKLAVGDNYGYSSGILHWHWAV